MNEFMDGLFAGSTVSGALGLEDFLLRLLVAFLGGVAVAWVYKSAHGAINYSQNFVQALVLLSMIVAVIMCVVGDSLAKAFGLGAALAIVRFRTPIKDALDTAFLFMTVAVGMAAGAGTPLLALAAALTCGAAAMFLSWGAFGAPTEAEGLLRFRFSSQQQEGDLVSAVLKAHCSNFRLSGVRTVSDDEDEFVYDVDLKKDELGATVVRELKSLGVHSISLLPAARVQGG